MFNIGHRMDWFPVALGATTAGWAGRTVWRVWRARRWPAAAGHVVAFEFGEHRGAKGSRYHTFGVQYRYAVGGAPFEGRRVGFGVLHEAADLALAGRGGGAAPVRPGAPVAVYYDPRRPGEAVLRRGVPVVEVVCGLLGLGFAAASLLGRL